MPDQNEAKKDTQEQQNKVTNSEETSLDINKISPNLGQNIGSTNVNHGVGQQFPKSPIVDKKMAPDASGQEINKDIPNLPTNQELANNAVKHSSGDLGAKIPDNALNSGGQSELKKPSIDEQQPKSEAPKTLEKSPIAKQPQTPRQTTDKNTAGNKVLQGPQGSGRKKSPNKNQLEDRKTSAKKTTSPNPSKEKKTKNNHSNFANTFDKLTNRKDYLSGEDPNSTSSDALNGEPSVGEQTTKKMAKVAKIAVQKLIVIAASNLGLFLIVFLILIIIFAIFSSNNGGYASEDGKELCYTAAKCKTVILKDGENEEKYALEDYIAGAMVNYYKKDLFLNDLSGNNENTYKALAVIIHSDIVTYSKADETAGTCTISDNNYFKEIYTPSTDDGTDSSATEGEVDNSGYDLNDISDDQITAAISQNNRLNKYYNTARSNASSVKKEITIGYSNKNDLFYDGYEANLYGSTAADNYKDIIKNYLPLTDVLKEEDKQIVYPICKFDESGNSNNSTYISLDFCSQVQVTDALYDGKYSGLYSFDKFIEGVVYNEERGWKDYPDVIKAQAVAARTYLYSSVKTNWHASRDGDTCYVETSLYSLGFMDQTTPEISQAVSETSGEYIIVDGEVLADARWEAFSYSRQDTENYYLNQKDLAIPKTWAKNHGLSAGLAESNNGSSHGNGMSQWGSLYLVLEKNYNYKDVIKFFYGGDVARTTTDYIIPIENFTSITGETTGYCGSGNPHGGMDFAASEGTPVYAAHSGTVIALYNTGYQCPNGCGSNYMDAGIGVEIDNGDGTYSGYMHFSSMESLTIGQEVNIGDKLGEVGNTGHTTPAGRGYHLHYQMKVTENGKKVTVNPRDYLPLDEKGYGVCYNS